MSDGAPAQSEFYRWIVTQADRDDVVGDIAADVKRDRNFPAGESTLAGLIRYLSMRTSDSSVHEAMKEAFREFSKARTR